MRVEWAFLGIRIRRIIKGREDVLVVVVINREMGISFFSREFV